MAIYGNVKIPERTLQRHAEALQNPIFLFQCWRGQKNGGWDTERVFFSREEATQFGDDNVHNYGQMVRLKPFGRCWRVYSVAAEGCLKDALSALAAEIRQVQ